MPENRKIKKILIANRGEIVLRVLRTIKELGLQSVVVYEKPDSEEYFIRIADEAILIGNGPRKDYLNIEKMIWAARKSGADAIHPGLGFLAENIDFSEACEKAGITFIGPPAHVIRKTGNKVAAREIMERAGIHVIPATAVLSRGGAGLREALAFGREQGYPIMLKSPFGGGGRGIRRVQSETELVGRMLQVRSEARKVFHDETIYAEKCLESPRHVEIPLLVDHHGNIVQLASRDCSIQRRHQKLLGIAPAAIAPDLLSALSQAAAAAVLAAGGVNAVSVEFLVDEKTGKFWFLEINTRLQVEHAVTEELLNIDIVREQIRIAEGHPLNIPPERLNFTGKAVQVRINCEDPKNNFMPDGGKAVVLYLPPGGPGIRLDGIIYQGYKIPIEYDSMLIKMTVRAYNWEQAVNRLKKALDLYLIAGPRTTIPFYRAICDEPDFLAEKFDTTYIQTHPELFHYMEPGREVTRLEQFLTEMHTAEFFPHSWL
jgi:pyruvate carboxylase subunit A